MDRADAEECPRLRFDACFVSQNYIESYACFLELLTAVNNKKQIVFVDLGGGYTSATLRISQALSAA